MEIQGNKIQLSEKEKEQIITGFKKGYQSLGFFKKNLIKKMLKLCDHLCFSIVKENGKLYVVVEAVAKDKSILLTQKYDLIQNAEKTKEIPTELLKIAKENLPNFIDGIHDTFQISYKNLK